jgi:hypothetical protein
MRKTFQSNLKISFILLIILPFLTGCPRQVLLYPQQIGPDKFVLEKKWDDKKVTRIEAYTYKNSSNKKSEPVLPAVFCRENQWPEITAEDREFTLVWQLRAKRDILAKDFILTIGELPQGFEQTVPSPSEKFYPAPDTPYFIITLIEPADDSMIAIGTRWFMPVIRLPSRYTSDEDPYIHRLSGMKFPMNIGNFKRSEVSFYDDTEKNMSVGYLAGSNDSGKTVITVYLYPATDAVWNKPMNLEQGFEEMVSSINEYFQNKIENVSKKNIEIKQNGKTYRGNALFFEIGDPLGNKRLMSRAYLFLHKNYFIKYRITYPKANHNAVAADIENFVESLQWFDSERN